MFWHFGSIHQVLPIRLGGHLWGQSLSDWEFLLVVSLLWERLWGFSKSGYVAHLLIWECISVEWTILTYYLGQKSYNLAYLPFLCHKSCLAVSEHHRKCIIKKKKYILCSLRQYFWMLGYFKWFIWKGIQYPYPANSTSYENVMKQDPGEQGN